jgi:hypothetical protein
LSRRGTVRGVAPLFTSALTTLQRFGSSRTRDFSTSLFIKRGLQHAQRRKHA